jgi:hypothetical protein
MDKNKIIKKFDELIREAQEIEAERRQNLEREGESVISPVGYYRLFSSTKILFTYLNASTYIALLNDIGINRINPGILQGLLESSKREFTFGLLSHPKILATADSMEDFLQQAEYLLEQDFKDPACVLIGGVLEETLRSMLENKYPEVKFNPKDGIRKFNKLLLEVSAYDKATYKLIDGYAEYRNLAAHGDYIKYTKSQVEDFLSFTRNFISNWFAIKLKENP